MPVSVELFAAPPDAASSPSQAPEIQQPQDDSSSTPAPPPLEDLSTMLKPQKRSSSSRTSGSSSEPRKPMKQSDIEILQMAAAATGRKKKDKKDKKDRGERGEKKQRAAERPAEKRDSVSSGHANVLSERRASNDDAAAEAKATAVEPSAAPGEVKPAVDQVEKPSALSFLVPDEPPTPPADEDEDEALKPRLSFPKPPAHATTKVSPPTPPQINVHRANTSLSSNSSTGTVRGPKHSRHPSSSISASKPALDTIFSTPESTSSASSNRSQSQGPESPRPEKDREMFLHPSRQAPPPPLPQQQQQQQQQPQQWFPPPPALPHSPHSPGRRPPPLGPGSRSDPSTPRPLGPLSPGANGAPPPFGSFPQQYPPPQSPYPPYPGTYDQSIPAYPPPRVDYEAQLSPARRYPGNFPSPAGDRSHGPNPFLYLDSPGPTDPSIRSPVRVRPGSARQHRSTRRRSSQGLNHEYYHPTHANKVRGSSSASESNNDWESENQASDSSYSPAYKQPRTPKSRRLPPTPTVRAHKDKEYGYQQLASHFNRNPNHRLYNKFSGLSHRLLLHMQDELLELEGLLAQLDAGNPEGTRSRRGMMNTPEGEQRLQILGAMSWKLGQYQAALKAENEMESIERASKDDLQGLKEWLDKERPVADDETHFLRDDMVVVGRSQLPVVKVEIPTPRRRKVEEGGGGGGGADEMSIYQYTLLGMLGVVAVLLAALIAAVLSVRSSFSLSVSSLEEAQMNRLRLLNETMDAQTTGSATPVFLLFTISGAILGAVWLRFKGML